MSFVRSCLQRPVTSCAKALLPLAALAASLAGCGDDTAKLYPVTGKVQWKGGGPATELVNYNVSMQPADRGSSATGVVQPDGSFTLSTLAENDGAIVGKHRVALGPPQPELDMPVPRPLIPDRYGGFETSGLEIEVKPEPNNVTIEVERRAR